MWGGPLDPTGSYTPMTQYSDGTGVLSSDFTKDNYPDQKRNTWHTLGDMDYFNISPPPASCTSIKLPKNTKVKSDESKQFDETIGRPVVCQGNTTQLNIGHIKTFIIINIIVRNTSRHSKLIFLNYHFRHVKDVILTRSRHAVMLRLLWG